MFSKLYKILKEYYSTFFFLIVILLAIFFPSVRVTILIIAFVITILNFILVYEKKIHHRILKIGIDIHGMIDYDPEFFAALSKSLIAEGHEVHIMTGAEITPDILTELRSYGMAWTHIYSISDYYKSQPNVKLWRDKKGRPWVDAELWNKAKGEYAKLNKIDLTLDDSPEYEKYFSTSFAYCNISNKSRKYRGPKAVMPEAPIEN